MFWFPKLDLTSIKVKQEFSTTHLDLDRRAGRVQHHAALAADPSGDGRTERKHREAVPRIFRRIPVEGSLDPVTKPNYVVFAVIHQQSFGSGGLRLPLRPLLRRFLGIIAQGAARTRRATVSR